MKTPNIINIFLVMAGVLCTYCKQNDIATLNFHSIQTIETPAKSGSSEPNLFVGDEQRVYLSWIEPKNDTGHALRFSFLESKGWSNPLTIAEGNNWFVNWADFPSIVAFKNGALAAHWLVKSGDGSYAYDVHISHSEDGGKNWSEPIIPHRDGTQTEHGFVSMLPMPEEQLFLVWLDGRKFAQSGNGYKSNSLPTNEMTLRFAMMDKNGHLHEERILDHRVCDCCPTSAVRTSYGVLVVYRDRSDEEVRDISIVRMNQDVWSEPQTIYPDGWKIKGCPVNGPAIASTESHTAVAWLTMANDTPRVKVIFSGNEGLEFGQPITVDDGDPLGRVDLVMLPDGSALVSWMENTVDGAEIRVRRILPVGTRRPSITITKSSKERASGFPRMVRLNNKIYMAWTQPDNPSIVRSVVATLNEPF